MATIRLIWAKRVGWSQECLHRLSLGNDLRTVLFLKARELSQVTSGLVLRLRVSQGKSRIQPLMWRLRFVTQQIFPVSQRYVLAVDDVLYLSHWLHWRCVGEFGPHTFLSVAVTGQVSDLRLAIQMSPGTWNQLLHKKDAGRVPDFFEWMVWGKTEHREFPVNDKNVSVDSKGKCLWPGNAIPDC